MSTDPRAVEFCISYQRRVYLMDTCVLFSKEVNEQGCFCFKINEALELTAPPLVRSFAEIKNLQENAATLVIESTLNASILELELAWQTERKARVAIPFALEDKLAQPLEELHFCFDKHRYKNNRYTIAVISKARIMYLVNLFKEHDIEFELITLDWFALQSQELCVTDTGLLIYNNEFKGALSYELSVQYQKNHPHAEPYVFSDSPPELFSEVIKIEVPFFVWIAKRIIQAKPLNLCQGLMQQSDSKDWIQKGYQLVGGLLALWLVTIILANGLSLYLVNRKNDVMDEQTATIYRQFFPGAKQIISPKFRINQLLGADSSENQTRFWHVLDQFSKVFKNDEFKLQQLRYQNKSLSVTLTCSDFSSLEELENKLKSLNLKVKQTQASTQDEQVVATLEIS